MNFAEVKYHMFKTGYTPADIFKAVALTDLEKEAFLAGDSISGEIVSRVLQVSEDFDTAISYNAGQIYMRVKDSDKYVLIGITYDSEKEYLYDLGVTPVSETYSMSNTYIYCLRDYLDTKYNLFMELREFNLYKYGLWGGDQEDTLDLRCEFMMTCLGSNDIDKVVIF